MRQLRSIVTTAATVDGAVIAAIVQYNNLRQSDSTLTFKDIQIVSYLESVTCVVICEIGVDYIGFDYVPPVTS